MSIAAPAAPAATATVAIPTSAAAEATLYGTSRNRRVTVKDLQAAKERGERWSMLTAYDYSTASVFDDAGIPVLLVGDSAANVVYGYDSTVPVSVDELIPLVRGVVRGAPHALVVADLPFGSYQGSPQQALETAVRFMKEGGAQAVKLEGGARMAPQVEMLVSAGIPVMAHIGLTPQSVHTLGGYKVQGRGDEAAHRLLLDAKALQHAGAFAVVLEVVPSELAAQVTRTLTIPTVGIGAGPVTDAQVLVWQDAAGFNPKPAKFVKQFADVAGLLRSAASRYADEVRGGTYPAKEHEYH